MFHRICLIRAYLFEKNTQVFSIAKVLQTIDTKLHQKKLIVDNNLPLHHPLSVHVIEVVIIQNDLF